MTLDILYFIDILGLYIVTMIKYRPNILYNPDIFYGYCHKNQISMDPKCISGRLYPKFEL